MSNSLPAEQTTSVLPASEEIRAGNDWHVTYINTVCSYAVCSLSKGHLIGCGLCLYSVSLVSGKILIQNGLDYKLLLLDYWLWDPKMLAEYGLRTTLRSVILIWGYSVTFKISSWHHINVHYYRNSERTWSTVLSLTTDMQMFQYTLFFFFFLKNTFYKNRISRLKFVKF